MILNKTILLPFKRRTSTESRPVQYLLNDVIINSSTHQNLLIIKAVEYDNNYILASVMMLC